MEKYKLSYEEIINNGFRSGGRRKTLIFKPNTLIPTWNYKDSDGEFFIKSEFEILYFHSLKMAVRTKRSTNVKIIKTINELNQAYNSYLTKNK